MGEIIAGHPNRLTLLLPATVDGLRAWSLDEEAVATGRLPSADMLLRRGSPCHSKRDRRSRELLGPPTVHLQTSSATYLVYPDLQHCSRDSSPVQVTSTTYSHGRVVSSPRRPLFRTISFCVRLLL